MLRKVLFISIVGVLFLDSCRHKGCTDETAENYEEKAKKDDGSCTYDNTYDVPTTYVFTDESGNSTVNFDGQKQRLDMLSEIIDYMKTGNTKGTVLDAQKLKDMYANNGYTWTDAKSLGMTGSTKQLKDKTASGDATITSEIEAYFDSAAVISAYNRDGSAGVSGVYPQDGNGPYLMDANGLQFNEIVEKNLMGAVFYYNIVLHYLSDNEMNVDNTTVVDAANGKYYTEMEHHWDEAYGYFNYEIDFPANGTDRFIGEYVNEMEDKLQSATKLMNAFLKGRAAISNNDLTTRDVQREIIKTELEKVFAACSIHYINSAISNITSTNARNHSLSEGYGFIQCLKYGATDNITNADVTSILNTIGKDFNNVTIDNLKSAKNQISTLVGLDDIKDQL